MILVRTDQSRHHKQTFVHAGHGHRKHLISLEVKITSIQIPNTLDALFTNKAKQPSKRRRRLESTAPLNTTDVPGRVMFPLYLHKLHPMICVALNSLRAKRTWLRRIHSLLDLFYIPWSYPDWCVGGCVCVMGSVICPTQCPPWHACMERPPPEFK
jgi:hypothetical protein